MGFLHFQALHPPSDLHPGWDRVHASDLENVSPYKLLTQKEGKALKAMFFYSDIP